MLELPEARPLGLFSDRRQYQDRDRVAALPSAVEDELDPFPKRLQQISGKVRHGGVGQLALRRASIRPLAKHW